MSERKRKAKEEEKSKKKRRVKTKREYTEEREFLDLSSSTQEQKAEGGRSPVVVFRERVRRERERGVLEHTSEEDSKDTESVSDSSGSANNSEENGASGSSSAGTSVSSSARSSDTDREESLFPSWMISNSPPPARNSLVDRDERSVEPDQVDIEVPTYNDCIEAVGCFNRSFWQRENWLEHFLWLHKQHIEVLWGTLEHYKSCRDRSQQIADLLDILENRGDKRSVRAILGIQALEQFTVGAGVDTKSVEVTLKLRVGTVPSVGARWYGVISEVVDNILEVEQDLQDTSEGEGEEK